MSLSDYLLLSVVGAFLIVLHLFCRYWTTHHRRGPLEEIWHRLTWIGGNK